MAKPAPQQLAFDLPARVRLGAEDFFVTDANATAYGMICNPNTWPDGKLLLTGPEGSGKTHLARIFAKNFGAALFAAGDVRPGAALPDGASVIEDVHMLGNATQEWLFHTHNHLRTLGAPLLITGTGSLRSWGLTLPDLISRLQGATHVEITAPDDPLLLAVMLKQFQDRQLMPTPEALTYLQPRLPRSFAAVRNVVEQLDQAALAQGKPLTRPFVAQLLDSPTAPGP